jgi:hypothetical protein
MDTNQIFGGNPLGVILRLAVLSIVVGVLLSTLGITPDNLFYNIELLFRRIYDMGFGAVRWIVGYLVLGAMVVVPIWFIARLLGAFGRKDGR